MLWKFLAVAGALVLYLVGTVVHELVHIVACWLTGSRVETISLMPPYVQYRAPNVAADRLVRLATVLVSLPLVTAYIAWLSLEVTPQRLLVAAFVVGFLPRSASDWAPLARTFKSMAMQR